MGYSVGHASRCKFLATTQYVTGRRDPTLLKCGETSSRPAETSDITAISFSSLPFLPLSTSLSSVPSTQYFQRLIALLSERSNLIIANTWSVLLAPLTEFEFQIEAMLTRWLAPEHARRIAEIGLECRKWGSLAGRGCWQPHKESRGAKFPLVSYQLLRRIEICLLTERCRAVASTWISNPHCLPK